MAPALTSNSFRLNSGLRPKPDPKTPKAPSTIAQAKQNPFGFGKLKDEPLEGAPKKPTNPFFIDFGKLPDTKSLIPVVSSPSTSLLATRRQKDPQTAFVAGATGQAGVRIAQTLLRQGFTVRAGVPDLSSAQDLARIATTYKVISPAEAKRLNAVESAYEEPEAIAKAIGPAAKVVVTIGPAEKGPAGEVTTDDALRVVRAAELAGVGHVVVVYDTGTGLSGASTYNVLDGIASFFSNLFAHSQPLTLGEFLSKVAETSVSYTLLKASLTEDYAAESSYGLVVDGEGSAVTTPGESKVPKLQIATLVADVFSNTVVAENKVFEVSSSPSATSKPIVEVFSAIPEDGRRKAYQESMVKAKVEEEALAASQKAQEAEAAANKLEEEVKKLSEEKAQAASLAEEAQKRAEAAGSSLESLLSRAKGFSTADFSWEKLSRQLAGAAAPGGSAGDDDEKPKTRIATIRGQARAQKLLPKKAVVKQPVEKKQKPKQGDDPKPDVMRKVFGLFQQETIYVDED